MQHSYNIFMLLFACSLPGCYNKPLSQVTQKNNEISLKDAAAYRHLIIESISEIVNKHDATEPIGQTCKKIQSHLISYISAESNTLKLPAPQELINLYQKISDQPTELKLAHFWTQLRLLKPVLYKLQTDLLFETQEILSISPAHDRYQTGKLAVICPLLDAFLRLSFDQPTDYLKFIINLFDLEDTPSWDNLSKFINKP